MRTKGLWVTVDDGDDSERDAVDHDESTDSASGSDEAAVAAVLPHRKREHLVLPVRRVRVRKPTYLVRKEEKEALADEIRTLEARLELLKLKVGLPTGEAQRSLETLQHANARIEETIHGNLLGLARFQSLIAQHLHSIPVDPLATFIHLPRDLQERRATLRAMRPMKLRRAKELVNDRLDGLSETKPYLTEERFVTRDGVYRCKRFDIHQFRGLAHGARQLFDALIYYLANMEISITERLGQLTIREDMDCIDPTLWNHRIVSTTGAGYVQDLNTVGFAEFVEGHASNHDNDQARDPYGIIASDSVDVDDLYPYVPEERVRKDVTAALMVSEVPGVDGEPPVVVLKRCVFVTIHKPHFALPTSVMDEVVANVASWSTVMSRFLRETVESVGTNQRA